MFEEGQIPSPTYRVPRFTPIRWGFPADLPDIPPSPNHMEFERVFMSMVLGRKVAFYKEI